MTERIEISVEQGGLKNVEFFVLVEIMIFESVFYKGNSKRPLLFELLIRLHQVQMKVELIPHILHIAGTSMVEVGIDGIYRGNNMVGVVRVLDPLQLVPLVKGDNERSYNLEPWLSSWWGDTLTSLDAMVWFEEGKRGEKLLWTPLLASM